jgi:hypothetical protein
MGLLSWDGKKFNDVSVATNPGMFDAYICCPGPSLALVDRDLRGPGAVVIAVNTAYPRVKPDYWIGLDPAPCYDHAVWHEPFPKISGSKFIEYAVDGQKLKEFPNTYFAAGVDILPWEMFQHRDPFDCFIWKPERPNTFYAAIHLAVKLGARRIFLIGTDFGGGKDYFDDRKLDDRRRNENAALYKMIAQQMPILWLTAGQYKTEIYSCTPNSPINADQPGGMVPYVTLDEAQKMTASHIPARLDGKVLDVAMATLCEWGDGQIGAKDGVMVALDAGMEWLLDWWWNNYSKHNKYPVCFVDYGMSPAGRAWCAKHSPYRMEFNPPPVLNHIWFRKPSAILKSPFERTVYVEPDCEIKGNIWPIFEMAEKGLALTVDPYNPWSKEYMNPPLATGVIGVKHGNPLVPAWAEAIVRGGAENTYRSDQEALNDVLGRVGTNGVWIMPKPFQWLRLDGPDNGQALIYHWTGPTGKDAIKTMLALPQDVVPPQGAPQLTILSVGHERLGLFEQHIDGLARAKGANQCEYILGVWGDSGKHREIVARYAKYFAATTVVDIDATGIFFPLPLAYNTIIPMAKSEKIMVIGSEVVVSDDVLTAAIAVKAKEPIAFAVNNSNGTVYVGRDKMIPLPFCVAVTKQDLDGIGGWDRAFENGIAFDDNDWIVRLLVSGCTFKFDFDHPFGHQAHDKIRTAESPGLWQRNRDLFVSRLNGYVGDLGLSGNNGDGACFTANSISPEGQFVIREQLLERGYKAKW